MLILSHIGYTVGVASRIDYFRSLSGVNYVFIGLMSILPDAVDRFLFVFVLPSAEGGRLVAHTVLFNAVLIVAIVAIRRHWWMYGLASMAHVLLDAPLAAPLDWARHAMWPLLGADLSFLGIEPGNGGASIGLFTRIFSRIGGLSDAYTHAPWWYLSLEAGGLAIIIALVFMGEVTKRRLRRSPTAAGPSQNPELPELRVKDE